MDGKQGEWRNRNIVERRAMTFLTDFIEKMRREHLPQIVVDTFAFYYDQMISGTTGIIPDGVIRPLDRVEITNAATLTHYNPVGSNALAQTVLIIVNVGLGKSMALTGPKSLLQFKDSKTFLQIIIEQATAGCVRLAFMNSFNTDAQTRGAVQALVPCTPPHFFLQHKFPKILRENFSPTQWPDNPALPWNPLGNGEIYKALVTSGLLRNLLDKGTQYALIFNCDNLEATMGPALLGYFATRGFPFMMEVAQRTPTDMKGGHIAQHVKRRLILKKITQCLEHVLAAIEDYYSDHNQIKSPENIVKAKAQFPTIFEVGILSISIGASHMQKDQKLLDCMKSAQKKRKR